MGCVTSDGVFNFVVLVRVLEWSGLDFRFESEERFGHSVTGGCRTSSLTNRPAEALNNLIKNQTSSVRVPQLRELPNPGPPLSRQTQLGPARHGHSPLKSDEPVIHTIHNPQLDI